MYTLNDSGDIFFDENKGCLKVKGNPEKTEQLTSQQWAVLKMLCERAGKVVTYESLYRGSHDVVDANLGDSRSIVKDIQVKVHEIRKALSKVGIEDASQLLATNRTIRGYEVRLPLSAKDDGASGAAEDAVDPLASFSPNRGDVYQAGAPTGISADGAVSNIPAKEVLATSYSGNLDSMQVRISEYAAFVRKCVRDSASIVEDADADVYYDEPAKNSRSKEAVIKFSRVGERGYVFEFQLSQLDYQPSFASLAMRFWNPLNLKNYLTLDREAAFTFAVDNAEGALASIAVEFKYGTNHAVFRSVSNELAQGVNRINIQLAPMDYAPLSEICEICFVVHPTTMKALDGKISIDDIGIAFDAQSMLV